MSSRSFLTAPTLLSARLILRAAGVRDLDDSAAMWGDPAVVRHIGGRPFTPEEVWTRLLRYAGLWALLGYGYWTMVDATTGRFVGEIGFADYRRAVVPPLGEVPEAGWVLARWAHGRGYASEALATVLAWADASLAGERTVCLIDPANHPSLRLARRFGFVDTGVGLYRGGAVALLERRRPTAG